MAIITILSSNADTGELDLSDKGRTGVGKGEPVTWKLGQGCGVSVITAITMKTTPPSTDIFSKPPKASGTSTNWKGTVSSKAKSGAEYLYTIYWKDSNGGTPPPYDPKIVVNTKE